MLPAFFVALHTASGPPLSCVQALVTYYLHCLPSSGRGRQRGCPPSGGGDGDQFLFD